MSSPTPIPRPVLYGAFALSGAAALSYEVIWTRSLSVVLGSTTFALSSILATFMLGLAIGGVLGGRAADRPVNHLRWFAAAELGIGALALASHVVIESMPRIYLPMYRAFHVSGPVFYAVQMGLCSIVMLAPTVLMGMTFPLVTRAALHTGGEVGSTVGGVYGANTLGSVAGALAAGFLLIPGLGLRGATVAAACANLGVAAVAFAFSGPGRRVALLLVAIVYLPLGALALREGPWSLVGYYTAFEYLRSGSYGEIARAEQRAMRKIYEQDGREGRVAAFRNSEGYLLLRVNGKIEGTGPADVTNTRLLALLPAAAHGSPGRMLVIGLGAGSTLAAARTVASSVDLAEISEQVIEAVRQHGPPRVLDGVRILKDDARNILLRDEGRWDVITSEPSYPTDFPVANLFSLEFYALAARRLSADGIFCQWLPYYMMTNDDVTMMVKTFSAAFPEVSLWKVSGSMDLLLLGSRSPFPRSPAEIVERVRMLNDGVPLNFTLSRTPEQVRDIAKRDDVPMNTDDRPRLEFRVARNFLVGDLAQLER